MGCWLLTTMEISLIFWSPGPNIIHFFFLSLKQCLQIAQVKASQKQNNIIEELLYADTFSYTTQLALSLNPVWWENDLRLQGQLLDMFLLQHTVVRQKSLAWEMCSAIFCIWGGVYFCLSSNSLDNVESWGQGADTQYVWGYGESL